MTVSEKESGLRRSPGGGCTGSDLAPTAKFIDATSRAAARGQAREELRLGLRAWSLLRGEAAPSRDIQL
ncbi:MAG: hypothetical protein WB989_24745, partial [Mycobacterium sp.]